MMWQTELPPAQYLLSLQLLTGSSRILRTRPWSQLGDEEMDNEVPSPTIYQPTLFSKLPCVVVVHPCWCLFCGYVAQMQHTQAHAFFVWAWWVVYILVTFWYSLLFSWSLSGDVVTVNCHPNELLCVQVAEGKLIYPWRCSFFYCTCCLRVNKDSQNLR